ncbi:SDR family oxidoreductase [Luteibacter aegosomaticola]|uniref:SDR family NAD(P)-dependent oxidoreductase n=1 Tax=Luteibacter aegosomaticola TaxID=2911538 RepID=UPI001FFAC82C|nr:SDR family oxidoreductase [Luteibacter aegosomaticola]UPG92110.1 SDR family oxidoreductase [Luteibacter aegosomaticola]
MSAVVKVAVITGASQGIGAGLVSAFLERGFRIVANSRAIPPSDHPDIHAVPGNIGDPEVAERVIREAVERFGRVDTLVNNAGVFVPKPFVEYTALDYANVLTVNLHGFFYVTQAAVRQMLAQESGHIVSITTTLVEHPVAGIPSVLTSLTKGGVTSATKSLAIEYATRGIRANAVSPGVIQTPMHERSEWGVLAALHPVHRMGEIKDIVDAVMYLENATFVTGEILHVDGGQSAGH